MRQHLVLQQVGEAQAGQRALAIAAPTPQMATGVRVRDYPITLDKLLKEMPDIG
jgi:xanthine dehydrogenase YagR molybdenum-binding subunit